jgi:CheY-like chemotaxis protein
MVAAPLHVLAVEDESADAEFIERIGAQSPLAASFRLLRSAEEARVYLGGEEPYNDRSQFPVPDLVLLDLKLRRMSGLDLLRWIRQTPSLRSMPVVVLSGTANATDLNRAYELGIDGYIVKSVDLKGLAATLSGVLVTLASRHAS